MSSNVTKTANGKTITVIPATKSLHPERDKVRPRDGKIRVAAYCRVSTTLEEQQGSYDLQEKYYETMIKGNPAWEFAGIYGDEGKSGTSLKGRTGFLTMMDDVRAGRIDYIITKASSRFGRNGREFMEVIDELDSYGVEVLFESEGIITSGKQDRFLLQIIGATNEHYSSSISNNIRWSNEKNMRKGKVTISYKTFLGYEKGPDGNPRIVDEEAKIVKRIYELFLNGSTYASIARLLRGDNTPTPGGKGEWNSVMVKRILTNEKYTGDVILQKTYTRDYLDKKSRVNNGEKAKVIVENNHEGIIDKATFARVQELVQKRVNRKDCGTTKSPLVGRVICGDCGDYFGHKTWVSRGRIKYDMWICNSKYTEKTAFTSDRCNVANLRQEWIEQGYIYAMNRLLARKGQILGKYDWKLRRIDARLTSGDIDRELMRLDDEAKNVKEEMALLRAEWEFTFGDKSDYYARKERLSQRAREIAEQKSSLEEERRALNSEKKQIQTFKNEFGSMGERLIKFSGKQFINTVDLVSVNAKQLEYQFYGGEKETVKIDELKKMCR